VLGLNQIYGIYILVVYYHNFEFNSQSNSNHTKHELKEISIGLFVAAMAAQYGFAINKNVLH